MNSTKPKATSWPSGKEKTCWGPSGKTLSEWLVISGINKYTCLQVGPSAWGSSSIISLVFFMSTRIKHGILCMWWLVCIWFQWLQTFADLHTVCLCSAPYLSLRAELNTEFKLCSLLKLKQSQGFFGDSQWNGASSRMFGSLVLL